LLLWGIEQCIQVRRTDYKAAAIEQCLVSFRF